jgi:hypothetical protein
MYKGTTDCTRVIYLCIQGVTKKCVLVLCRLVVTGTGIQLTWWSEVLEYMKEMELVGWLFKYNWHGIHVFF